MSDELLKLVEVSKKLAVTDLTKFLTEAREVGAKATPGVWQKVSSLPVFAVSTQGEWGVWDVVTATGREYARHAHHEKHGSRQEDAEFIAFARNHWDEMLDLLERQGKALEVATKAIRASNDRLFDLNLTSSQPVLDAERLLRKALTQIETILAGKGYRFPGGTA